jgi:hypothetical protein
MMDMSLFMPDRSRNASVCGQPMQAAVNVRLDRRAAGAARAPGWFVADLAGHGMSFGRLGRAQSAFWRMLPVFAPSRQATPATQAVVS